MLCRRIGALIRGSTDLSVAINRSLQSIRRSFSLSRELNYQKPLSLRQDLSLEDESSLRNEPVTFRSRSIQWYNSLSSLLEKDDDENAQDEYAQFGLKKRKDGEENTETTDFPDNSFVRTDDPLLNNVKRWWVLFIIYSIKSQENWIKYKLPQNFE